MKHILMVVVAVAISCIAYAQGNNGLIAHWNLNGTANDAGPNGLNGTITGTVTNAAGYNGLPNTAMDFIANGGGIDVPYNALMNTNNFSICALAKVRKFNSAGCQSTRMLCRVGSATDYYMEFFDNAYDQSCGVYSPTQDRLNAYGHYAGVPYSVVVAGPIIDTGKWYCVTATYAQDTLRFYVDGALVVATHTPTNYTPTTDPITIGYDNVLSQFDGQIDDIRLYSRALSGSEVGTYCDSAKMLPHVYCDTLKIYDTVYKTVVDTVVMHDTVVIHDTAHTAVAHMPAAGLQQQIVIMPNPAHDYVGVYFMSNPASGTIQLINEIGQMVKEKTIQSDNVTFELNELPPGLYTIKVLSGGQTMVKKILKN